MAVATQVKTSDTRDVAQSLIRYIQSGELSLGDRLPSIRSLAEKLQSNASIVRDALQQVQAMGLVKILPRSGVFVQSFTCEPLLGDFPDALAASLVQLDHNLFHLLESRQLVEVDAAAKAASRRRLEDLLPLRESLDAIDAALDQVQTTDTEETWQLLMDADIRFHVQIAELSGNPVQVSILKSLLGLIRPHLAQVPWTADRIDVARSAHHELYDALLRGDADLAADRMRQHLQYAYDALLRRIWGRLSPTESGARS